MVFINLISFLSSSSFKWLIYSKSGSYPTKLFCKFPCINPTVMIVFWHQSIPPVSIQCIFIKRSYFCKICAAKKKSQNCVTSTYGHVWFKFQTGKQLERRKTNTWIFLIKDFAVRINALFSFWCGVVYCI